MDRTFPATEPWRTISSARQTGCAPPPCFAWSPSPFRGGSATSALPPKADPLDGPPIPPPRSEEHTSELQSLIRISSAVFCLKKTKNTHSINQNIDQEDQNYNH